jgi:hypothetical protein
VREVPVRIDEGGHGLLPRFALDEAQQIAGLFRRTAADQHRFARSGNHHDVAALSTDHHQVVRKARGLQGPRTRECGPACGQRNA